MYFNKADQKVTNNFFSLHLKQAPIIFLEHLTLKSASFIFISQDEHQNFQCSRCFFTKIGSLMIFLHSSYNSNFVKKRLNFVEISLCSSNIGVLLRQLIKILLHVDLSSIYLLIGKARRVRFR